MGIAMDANKKGEYPIGIGRLFYVYRYFFIIIYPPLKKKGCIRYMSPEFPVCTQKLDIYTFGLALNEFF
jgi:hypothetical protein